jgi:hypothetical protein
MCLEISPYQDQNELELEKWFGSRKKFAYVYKILQKYSCEDFYRSEYYPSYKWDFSKQKVFQVDRPNKPTYGELFHRRIKFGLHVFTSLNEVKYWEPKVGGIVKFRVRKEDVVAVDNFNNEAVCTRLEFVKIVGNKNF